MRVLIVEDARRLLAILVRRFRDEGYAVDGAASGEQALQMVRAVRYDAILLDLRLPDVDGFEVCSRIRAEDCWAPVLMLTARDALDDRVHGLDSGADDYLTKPFEFPELFARVRALVRRGGERRPPTVTLGDLVLDPATHRVCRGDTPIELTAKEFALLEYLLRHPGRVLSRRLLVEHVWNDDYVGISNIVDVYVARLRDKVDRRFDRSSLETVRGVGYRIRDEAGERASLA